MAWGSDRKSLFGRYGHAHVDTSLKERFHGVEGVITGAEPQERDRGSPLVGPGRALDRPEGRSLPLWNRRETNRPCRDGSAARVHHDRFGVIIGEGIIQPGLDDGFARWVGPGVNTDALLPQTEVAEDALDHLALVDQGHEP